MFEELEELNRRKFNIHDKINNKELITEAKQLADGIISNNGHRGRTPERVFQDSFRGLISEHVLKKVLGFEKSRHYEYDLIHPISGCKLEVKTQSYPSKWWSIPSIPGTNKTTYDYFIKNSHNIDYIILMWLDMENLQLTPLKALVATQFNKCLSKSKYNDGWYINETKAQNLNIIKYFS